MSEELRPTSPADYPGRKTKVVKLSSGPVFKIRQMNAMTTAKIMALMQKEGDATTIDTKKFVLDNISSILHDVLIPSVVEPRLEPEDYNLVDAIELLVEIMQFSGMIGKKAEEIESFRPEPSSPSP
jgi:hypothetical protein